MAISLLIALLMLGVDPDQSPSAPTPVVVDAEPAGTRLFFGPTGRSLAAGEVYVSAYEVVLPFVQIGVTDRFSIGAGAPMMAGALDVPAWVTPKLQVFRGTSTQASVGVVHVLNINDGALGVAYGVVTRGSADSAVTVGSGYAYERFGDSDGGSPVVMLGGERRVRQGVKLLTENYVFPDGALVTGGVRLFGKHFSADLGMGSVLVDGAHVVFPVINFVWKF